MRGKISIFNPQPVNIEEAFNQLSSALAVNGIALNKEGDVYMVRQARMAQRGLIETGPEVPALKPEKMFTWVLALKNTSASDIMKEIRILSSKDGEITAHLATNQLVITDWVSSLHRIRDILAQLDKPQPRKSTVSK